MSYPPPPGLSSQNSGANSSGSYSAPGTATHSLPPRPSGPPPSFRAFSNAAAVTASAAPTQPPAFAFRPRQVAPPTHSAQPTTYSSGYSQPAYSAPPGSYGSTPSPYGGAHYSQPPVTGAPPAYGQNIASTPHIVNPFPLPGQQQYPQTAHYGGAGGPGGGRSRQNNQPYDPRYPPLDPEFEAQIAQQQSIYIPADQQHQASAAKDRRTGGAVTGSNNAPLGPLNPAFGGTSTGTISAGPTTADGTPVPSTAAPATKEKQPTVIRQGGGQTWADSTLLEWDPAHFRLFVGNLAGEVTDESLLKAFSKYPSVQKARVIRDKRTTKSKGYGFVSFSDGDEYFKAAREMNGKYIGSHPVLLKRSNTEIRPIVPGDRKNKKGGAGGGGGAGTSSAGTGAGVKKKVKKNKTQERKVLG
ncbi:hypothetical protein DFH27DRAFT_557057 [Peziza echinospora]|nr:hypothetical protein DFH27DRAFT_557057 [Peziza echinospora]